MNSQRPPFLAGLRHRIAATATRCAVALCLVVSCDPAFALSRGELYQATVTLADRSEAARGAAFQLALKTVLIRVTGRRNADTDPALASLTSEARRYVQQYRAAPGNQLSVAFDAAAIERWLIQNGQPIWGEERPSTFVWLAVPASTGPAPQPAAVARAEDTADWKTAIDAEALVRGIPLRWPTGAELLAHHLDFAALTSMSNAALIELAQRLGAEGVLIGRPAGGGGAPSWRWIQHFRGENAEFYGNLEGVDGAADAYAALYAATGSQAAFDIEVGGIVDVAAYARAQGYLETLAFVSHVAVQAVNGDRVEFRLTARGGLAALQRSVTLNSPLEPIVGSDGGLPRFRLRPSGG